MFYLTIIFGVGYLAWFGGMGGFSGYSKWTSASEHAADKAREDAKMEAAFKPFANQPINELARDPKALALGQSIFSNTCAACHPYFTGQAKFIDTEGRVDRFNKRYAKQAAAKK